MSSPRKCGEGPAGTATPVWLARSLRGSLPDWCKLCDQEATKQHLGSSEHLEKQTEFLQQPWELQAQLLQEKSAPGI